MPTRSDLDLLDTFIRKAAHEPIKHHEVSMALQALERIERALKESTQPAPVPTEKK